MDEDEILLPPPPKKGATQPIAAADEELLPPPPKKEPTFGETALHAAGGFTKVASDIVPQTVQAVGIISNYGGNLISKATNALGLTDNREIPTEENPIYQLGKKIEQLKSDYADYNPDPRLADSFWATDIPQGLGSVAAVFASQGRSLFKDVGIKAATELGVKAAIKEGAKTLTSAPVTTGAIMMAVPEYDAAINAGSSEDEAFSVFLQNYLLGGTEAFPIEHALSFINKVTGNRIMRMFKSGLFGSMEEAIQEAVQTYASNRVAAGTYDPDRDPMDGVVRAVLAGAIIGGGLGGVGGAVSKKTETEDQAIAKADDKVSTDPSVSTGDPAVDAAIDAPYAEIAARLDDIDMEPIRVKEAEEVEEKLESDIADFSDIEEQALRAEELPTEEAPVAEPAEAGPLQEGPVGDFLGQYFKNQPEQPATEDDISIQNAKDQADAQFNSTMADYEDANGKLPGAEDITEEDYTGQRNENLPPPPPKQQPIIENAEGIGKQTEAPSQEEAPKRQESKQVRVRNVEEDRLEAEQRKAEKLDKEISNSLKLKPGARLKRLQTLDERTLDNPEMNKKVVKELDKLQGVNDEKAFKKQMKEAPTSDKLDVIAARIDNGPLSESKPTANALEDLKRSISILENNKDNPKAIQDANNIFEAASEVIQANDADMLSIERAAVLGVINDTRAKFDKALEPQRKAEEKERAKQSEVTKAKTDERDKLLTKIARSVKKGVSVQVDLDVKSFQEWREKQGYTKPMSKEEILKKASAEFYTSKAKSEERKVKEAEDKEKSKARKAAEESIRKEFGLSDDAQIEFFGFEDVDLATEDYINEHFSNFRQANIEEVFDRIAVKYSDSSNYVKAIRGLFDVANKVAKKYNKNGLEVYFGDRNTLDAPHGFHVYDATSNREMMFFGNQTEGDVDAHELIHMVTRAAVVSLAGTNKSNIFTKSEKLGNAYKVFYKNLNEIYTGARNSFRDELLQIERAMTAGKDLTPKQIGLQVLTQGYLLTRGYKNYSEHPLTLEEIEDIHLNTFQRAQELGSKYPANALMYMFYDSDEMFAESMSNPYAAGIMSLLESDKQFQGAPQSFFSKMVEGLKELLDGISKAIGIDIKPVKNNYLQQLTSFVSQLEKEVLSKEQTGLEESPESVDGVWVSLKRSFSTLKAMAAAAGPKLNKMPPKLVKVLNKLASTSWKNKTIKSEADVQKMVDKINTLTKKNKIDASATHYIWTRIQKYRAEVADAKKIQTNALDYGKDLPEYKSSTFARDLNDFSTVDLDELTITQVRVMEKGILDLVTGAVPDQKAYNIANKDKATKYLKDLLPTAGKYAVDPNIFGFSLKQLANPATFASVLAQYNTPVAQKLFKTLYGGMLSAKTQSQTETNTFMNKMYDIAKHNKLQERDYVAAHMAGVAFTTTVKPTDPDYWAEVHSNLDTIVQNATNKVEAVKRKSWKGSTMASAQLELKIAQDLNNRVRSLKSFKGVLSKQQQELYDTFRSFITEHEQDATRNARGVWGDLSFNKFNNYIPTKTLGKVTTGDLTGPDKLVSNTKDQNLWQMLQDKKNYGKIVSRQNGATKQRTAPKGYFYDYNIMSVANKYAAPLLFDIYATRELKTLNHLLNGVKAPVSVDGKNIYSVMSAQAVAGLNYQLKSIVGQYTNRDSDTGAALRWLYKAKDTLATARLATGGQFFVQASSAIPASLIMHPKGFTRAMKVLTGAERGFGNFKTLQDFIQKNGMSIQLRDYLFERFETADTLQAKGLARGVGELQGNFEKSATYLLRGGDKFAARMVWFSAFFQAGGTLENPTRDAVLEGERMVGILQNMSDVSFAAPMFKADTNSHRMIIHMLFAFKSFSMNAAINTYYSAKHSLTSSEARKVFAANMFMAAAYHAAAVYLIKPLYGALSDALFGGDDDDEEKNYSNWEYISQNTVYDMAVGAAAPSVIDALARYQLGRWQSDYAKSEGESFDPIMDSALFVPKDVGEALSESAGQYGDLGKTWMDAIGILSKSTMESLDILEDSSEEAQDIAMYKLLQDLATLTKIVPFRGDVIKLLKEKVKRENKEIKAPAAGGGDEGTDFADTEFDDSAVEEDITEFE